ncbi:substrate-binding and VWA domain-containing protein [Lipingzhangella sp. LS1_29]|uniref:Substrate-binding and VWA domain-containing protein n=1 Tax=Lipingzhangella rawalii TaxID=2055835 RepID=A0ABU2H8P2_9ACTN|nr:substrate-binding and VWA domain-containing protein [Lipingzhangella rawalii]MDS1270964.1 substrate-binding and VWA domain-containing protein [Lipingzhangella rawalii]
MTNGRHRHPSRVRQAVQSPLGIAAIITVLLIVLTLMVPLGVRFLGCSQTQYLRVTSALGIAPVLQEAAAEFNNRNEGGSGTCLYAQASELPPHLVLTELAGGVTASSTIAPDVWVPESSAWVELVRISEPATPITETEPRSLASSPVVLAAPEDAEGIGGDEPHSASWTEVLPGERDPDRPVVMVDPNRGADGMTTMYAVRDELGTGDEADAAMTEFVRDVQLDSAFGEIEPSGIYPGAEPLTVLPEQAVWEYNERERPNDSPPLEAHYPSEGTVSLDYPFVVTTPDDPEKSAAAEELYEILHEEEFRERLRDMGFREPDGSTSPTVAQGTGIAPGDVDTHDGLTGDRLLASVEDWNRLSMPSRALVLVDVSAAAAEDLDGGPEARIEVARGAAQLGLEMFPDETDMGLWLMSDEHGPEGREELEDLGRLDEPGDTPDETRRDRLHEVAENIEVEGGGSRLYDNILAAYQHQQDNYAEDKINSVIMLVADADNGSSDIEHAELVAELQDSFDPQEPVTMFIIAFGDQPDAAELDDIARATSGTSFVTEDPDEIGEIFLDSISRRLCVPDCDS